MKNIILSACMLMLLGSCSTTIYFVRHAEKQTANQAARADDPALSEAGMTRAKILADTLTNDRIDGIFATPLRRTQATAQPTATIMARPVTTYQTINDHMLVDSLARQKNRRFLVVGHSNTVPDMLRHMGLRPSMTNIDDADYDNLFVVQIKWLFSRKITLTEKTYGKVSP